LKRSEAGVERAERSGGLHKHSAEAWGHPLWARGAELPLGAVVVVFALQMIRAGVAGRNRPAEVGGGGHKVAADREEASSHIHSRQIGGCIYRFLSRLIFSRFRVHSSKHLLKSAAATMLKTNN
jgi:hypothetical protein